MQLLSEEEVFALPDGTKICWTYSGCGTRVFHDEIYKRSPDSPPWTCQYCLDGSRHSNQPITNITTTPGLLTNVWLDEVAL